MVQPMGYNSRSTTEPFIKIHVLFTVIQIFLMVQFDRICVSINFILGDQSFYSQAITDFLFPTTEFNLVHFNYLTLIFISTLSNDDSLPLEALWKCQVSVISFQFVEAFTVNSLPRPNRAYMLKNK